MQHKLMVGFKKKKLFGIVDASDCYHNKCCMLVVLHNDSALFTSSAWSNGVVTGTAISAAAAAACVSVQLLLYLWLCTIRWWFHRFRTITRWCHCHFGQNGWRCCCQICLTVNSWNQFCANSWYQFCVNSWWWDQCCMLSWWWCCQFCVTVNSWYQFCVNNGWWCQFFVNSRWCQFCVISRWC